MSWKDKKRTIIEVLLVLIILIQAGVIYFFYKKSLNDALEMTKDMACVSTSSYLFGYYEKGQYEELIGLGEYLYKKGFEDKELLHELAIAYFVTGNEKKAAEYLERALRTGHLCKILKPKYGETVELDEAIARYQLSEIYLLLGDKEKSHKEHLNAHSIVKRIFSDKYKQDIVNNIFKNHSLVERRIRILNKKEKNS